MHDHCRAIDLILHSFVAGETWNVGGGSSEPNIKVVDAVCKLVDEEFRQSAELKVRYPRSASAQGKSSSLLMQYVRDRPGHDRRYAVNGGKIARLGFTPLTSLSAGLAATVRWYVHNETWWRDVVSGEYRNWYERRYVDAD